jgi:hypothetical protein
VADHTQQSPASIHPDYVAVGEWLKEASEFLLDPSRNLAEPPHPELQSVYESLLERRQQWESAQEDFIASIEMQSLQTVGSILAHDLHNLSLRLALLSQNLEQFYGEPAFLHSAKNVLDDTVDRMQRLVDGFRQRQRTVIVKILTDVREILHSVIHQAGIRHMEGIRLIEEYGEEAIRIWADPFFLASAFRVLLENAVQAMPRGGDLLVRCTALEGGGTEVDIQDTGLGMSREFIARELFAPFRSTKGRGLGLGMYICQHIIRLHDGEIDVFSEEGCGTLFRLRFPQGEQAS